MPKNKNALIRYKILDDCFRSGRWTINELVNRVSSNLDEATKGAVQSVSQRTLHGDIMFMRSVHPGYSAPIVIEHGFYYYSNRSFSIHITGLSEQQKTAVQDALLILRQFDSLPNLRGLIETLAVLHDNSMANDPNAIIQFEVGPVSKGIEHLPIIYEAVKNKKALLIHYKPFKAVEVALIQLHPYLIKEYRNRWFAFGWNPTEAKIWNIALDRIEKIQESVREYRKNVDWNPEKHFEHIIGVTLLESEAPIEITFEASFECAHYLLTKPIHHSQKLLEITEKSYKFSLYLARNNEFRAELRRWGGDIFNVLPHGFI